VLVPFGGGGPLHACGLAEQLGVDTIFVPPHAGVLSAVGLAITPERRERMISYMARVASLDAHDIESALTDASLGVAEDPAWSRAWTARMRYVGQGHELDIPLSSGDDGPALESRFNTVHLRRNGFTIAAPVEVIGIRHVASGPATPIAFARTPTSKWSDETRIDDGGTFDARVIGPAVITLRGATLRIARGWTGTPHVTGGWLLTRFEDAS
jgi:N-methylhydantoinase A